MATDKKISELPVASSISGTDTSVLVSGGADSQFAFSTLLQYVSAGIATGAIITYGTVMPQAGSGKNGDVFINTAANLFAQKIAGTWTVIYTLPSGASGADGTVLYGLSNPSGSVGNNNDTYINTGTGIFYQKAAGAWSQVFSMQTGPAGPRGNTVLGGVTDPDNSTGTNGDFYINTATLTFFGPKTNGIWPSGSSIQGTNGSTILNGASNPSNSIGNNGDFYINNALLTIFGPKAAGIWPAGNSLVYSPVSPSDIYVAAGTAIPYFIDITLYPGYTVNSSVICKIQTGSAGFKRIFDFEIDEVYTAGVFTGFNITGHDDGTGKFAENSHLILKA